jgi:hypothetical protein
LIIRPVSIEVSCTLMQHYTDEEKDDESFIEVEIV